MVAQPFELTKKIKTKQIYDGNKKLLKIFFKLCIIIRCTLQENNGICLVIRDFVGIHREGLQSICQRTTVNFSTHVR